jgi:hypothetical protein
MKTYDLVEIKSGTFLKSYWVTLGFSSNIKEHDVVHVVVGQSLDAQQIRHGTNGVYLERFDQSLACYKGADHILVGKRDVTLTLNQAGGNALRLPKQVRFVWKSADREFDLAKAVFKKMASLKWAKVIQIVDQRSGVNRKPRSGLR